MPPNPVPRITLSTVLGAMRDGLRSLIQQNKISFGELMVVTMRELARIGIQIEPGTDYRGAWERLRDIDPLSFVLVEGYYQLLTFGYIVPWPNTPNAPNRNWFHITERGKQWISSTEPVPEDSDGFLAGLDRLIPGLDPVVRQYIVEAVITYNRQAWFASAVMIGAASEKAVYMLAEALLIVTGGRDRQALEKSIKERNLPNLFEQITKVITRHRESGTLPYEVHQGCDQHLPSIFETIRVQRNEAVHPTIGQVTPEMVRLTLSAFPSACRKVYDLIAWCHACAR